MSAWNFRNKNLIFSFLKCFQISEETPDDDQSEFDRLQEGLEDMPDDPQGAFYKLQKGKLEFMAPHGDYFETKESRNTEGLHKNKNVLRRFFDAACSCYRKREKETKEEDFVMYNPSFKPA